MSLKITITPCPATTGVNVIFNKLFVAGKAMVILMKKVKIKFTDFECNLLINGMNEFHNMLLSVGIPTEDVDELLLKIINKSER